MEGKKILKDYKGYGPDFLKEIPKTDLHLHLDGSLRLSTLIALAKRKNIELPSYTEEGLKHTVFKEKYVSLDDYLKGFAYTTAVLQDSEALEQAAYELSFDCFAEGVRYIEVRFAPQLHINEQLSFEDIMIAVDKGFKKAKDEINSGLLGDEPEFEYGIIVCAMRFFNQHFSKFYKTLFEIHKYSAPKEIIVLGSMELAKACVKLRNESEVRIVGYDLAGSENGYPAIDHKSAYEFVHKNFIRKTVHAGEAYGAESIFQAITELQADRIGHGLFLFDERMIHSEEIKDKKKYINDLVNFIANKRVTIEVCLTSNLQTSPVIRSLRDHSFKRMLEEKLSVTLCTDNRLVSNTNSCKEIDMAVKIFDLQPKQLKNIIIYGFKRSFYYGTYVEKRSYVRKVIEFYDKIEQKFLGKPESK